ncbi:DUF6281 family protein [Streptomyces sp. NPDC007808]|uniref:DUF6281 family protein n=1 Tax=Streptomyces sp. NPDC007808 TaxID=3364779 RepID=UPI0036C3EBE4
MKRAAQLVTMAALVAAAGCTGASTEGVSGSASCSGLVTYDSRGYLPTEKSVLTVGERLGTATVAGCDDTPNDSDPGIPESTTGAYAIEGADPTEAIAVGDSPAEAVPMAAR